MKVSGFGGLFFRSRDPGALGKWYQEHFGINGPGSDPLWHQEAGPTVFAPFDADTDYFGRREQAFMINFRVADLDGLLAELRAANVRMDEKIEEVSYGRFAWVYDPEGNKIELWQPLDDQPATEA
jgi:predicted enzyme related to lactoylglutathione lyase